MATLLKNDIFVVHRDDADHLEGDQQWIGEASEMSGTVPDVDNAAYIQKDTGKVFFYDQTGTQWDEFGGTSE